LWPWLTSIKITTICKKTKPKNVHKSFRFVEVRIKALWHQKTPVDQIFSWSTPRNLSNFLVIMWSWRPSCSWIWNHSGSRNLSIVAVSWMIPHLQWAGHDRESTNSTKVEHCPKYLPYHFASYVLQILRLVPELVSGLQPPGQLPPRTIAT